MSRTLTEQEILERIKNKFPNKFDYSKWEFKSYREKVTLICNDCGSIIETTPAFCQHLKQNMDVKNVLEMLEKLQKKIL